MQDKQEILQKWANANRNKENFADALCSLLYYAAANIVRKSAPSFGEISPKEAFLTILPYIKEPLGIWVNAPESNEKAILEFCSKEHSVKILPQNTPCTFDLRGVQCPECSMRARLLVSDLKNSDEALILLDAGSPSENVPTALIADGHTITSRKKNGSHWEFKVIR